MGTQEGHLCRTGGVRTRHAFGYLSHLQMEELRAAFPPLRSVLLREPTGGWHWNDVPREMRNELARCIRKLFPVPEGVRFKRKGKP